VLESGLTWQIGNDEKVSIWNDKWIPNLPSFTVQSPVSVLQAEARVSELIDHITRWWNFPFIHSVFRPDEANVITSLALSPLLREDRRIWMGTKNSLFSVRSAYHMEKSCQERDKGECSLVAIAKSVWRQIWKFPSPPVLKHFIWKVCHEILPTKVNLFKRCIG
jgi:hypothetical protein